MSAMKRHYERLQERAMERTESLVEIYAKDVLDDVLCTEDDPCGHCEACEEALNEKSNEYFWLRAHERYAA